jgi:hypothetical protein
MNILLAVSKSGIPQEEPKAYWCTKRSHQSRSGNLVLVYIVCQGISQVFKITHVDTASPEISCIIRDMTTVLLQHILTLPNPLTVIDIREHPLLCNMKAFRRNFQDTTFFLEKRDFVEIIRFLAVKNPAHIDELLALLHRIDV